MFLKKCYDHNIWNNEKENNAAVLILLTDANLKNLYWLMTAFHCVISNFEKKNVLLLTKDFFSRSFHSYKGFHERVSCVKKCNLKAIWSNEVSFSNIV